VSNNKTRWSKEHPPNTLLAIDPGASFPKKGVPYAGACYFQHGDLVAAGLVLAHGVAAPFARPNDLVRRVCSEFSIPRTSAEDGEPLTVLAVERPIVYKNMKTPPNDIVNLREITGAFLGGVDAEFYSAPAPGEWTGSLANLIVSSRVLWKVAAAHERMLLMQAGVDVPDEGKAPKDSDSHVIDALGIGFYVLGRMRAGGVI
jgi:hypothetical protein